jgi:serine phosphatase RsbU (regulator of sigma subunit)
MDEAQNKEYEAAWEQEVKKLMVQSSTASWPLTSFCFAFFIFVEISHRKDEHYIIPFYFLHFGSSIVVLIAHLLRKSGIKYPFVVNAYGTSVLVPIVATIAACLTATENVFTYFYITTLVIVVRGLLYCQKVSTLATIAVFSHSLIFITVALVRPESYFSLPNILSTNIIQLFMIIFALSGTKIRYKLTRDNFMNTLRIQHAYKTIEEKNIDITDSINYARRIQRSLLPQKQFLDQHLGDHCIFYRPKDIVSGDFYWASKLSNGDFVMVVADSTGHGVPGAIMSMLNIASLNESQINSAAMSPAGILDHARRRIIEHLNHHEEQSEAKDGMDAIVISISSDFKKLTWAAANNSLWLVRNGDVQQLKGDKMSVGKDTHTHEMFAEQTLELRKNDLVFMFTDGYTDQFGGPKGKKFMISRFRDLMKEAAGLSPGKINEKLSHHFNEWRGHHEQTDDVLVFAWRVG